MIRCPSCHASIAGSGVPPTAKQSYICPACGSVVVVESEKELCWFCKDRPPLGSKAGQGWICRDAGLNSQEAEVIVPRCARCASLHSAGGFFRFLLLSGVFYAEWLLLGNRQSGLVGIAITIIFTVWIGWPTSRWIADLIVRQFTLPRREIAEHNVIRSHLCAGWRFGMLPRS